jgi:hypothetical protein
MQKFKPQPREADVSGHEPSFTCTHCGKKSEEVRPKFSQARMGRGWCWRGSDDAGAEPDGEGDASAATEDGRRLIGSFGDLLPSPDDAARSTAPSHMRYVKAAAKPVQYRACSSSWSRTHDNPRQVGDDNEYSYGVA